MTAPLEPGELMLRSELEQNIPLSPSTIWRLEQRGAFPRRIPISTKRVAWRRSEIETWLAERMAASRSA
jgi:prophage regulatory protein